jgi:hypothetical protein
MSRSTESHRAAGRIGGLRTAALTVDLKAHTKPARDARWQKYLDRVPAEITDPAERTVRAERLRRADMIALSQRASATRRRAARTRQRGPEPSQRLRVAR